MTHEKLMEIQTHEVIYKLISLGVKAKYISSVYFSRKFHIGRNEYSNVCDIELTSHKHAYKTLKCFKYKDYETQIYYLGEFSELPPSKSYICKRTPEEIAIIERTHNPCVGCNYINTECNISACQVIDKLNY